MIENGNSILHHNKELKDSLTQIRHYLEKNIRELSAETQKKDNEILALKNALDKANRQAEGNSQLINKLLGELGKLQNDIEWYKLTYEKRSLLGTLRQKLFRK